MKNPKHLILASAILVVAVVLGALPALTEDDAPQGTETASAEHALNLNTASESQLQLLPRVGPALAKRIVEFRDANGKFEQAEDLMLVRGIGEKTFALMKPYVKVSGDTTLADKVKASWPAPSKEGSDD